MIHQYDAIVLGAGGVGSAALFELARRGLRVVGVDRFSPPHDRGSTHGQTRVIRQAYFEHPDYVPLLLDACKDWRELEARTGRTLYYPVGLVEVGSTDGAVVPGVLRAAALHQLPVERLSADDVVERWPGLRVPGDFEAVFEPGAGYLLVEDCVRAYLEAATAAGAELVTGAEVLEWNATQRAVHVRTSLGELQAERLIIAAGAWAGKLLAELKLELHVRRKSLFWYEPIRGDHVAASRMPVFLYELPGGVYYGFPMIDPRGVKVAEHSGGHEVDDPLSVDRTIDMDEQQRVSDFIGIYLPEVSQRLTDHSVCLYTMSPDEHFIIDRHPLYDNVVFAAGLSGHGFKFVPVLGRALADLAIDGRTGLPIEFLSLARFRR
jgi:monomeric sarcosine oxidase